MLFTVHKENPYKSIQIRTWQRPLFMHRSNGSFPLCQPAELFPLWPFGDTLHQLDVHNMRIPTSNRAWMLTITEMLHPEECVALCLCNYNLIAAFEQHLHKQVRRASYWNAPRIACNNDDSSTSMRKMCFTFVHNSKTHGTMHVALTSCAVPLHYFVIFFIFFSERWATMLSEGKSAV